VIAVRSTGYGLLDSAAIAALRRWRWKPGTWREVDMPIAFQKVSGPPKMAPPGTVQLRNK
jgi:outer membrane biosynthesis protein TonB